ncbi:MAG TPA: GtrA family protein [Candidatus Dormibacteraeota bacterium]|nr:GtrA family protein [Candidatus Dormibacteraeota bacterium]
MPNEAAPGLVRGLTHRRGVRQFLKFGIVGASGMVVNFVVAHVLEKTTEFSWFADFAIGFMVGGVSNYIFNRVWTFGSRRNPLLEGLQFLVVSGVALLAGKLVFTIAERAGFHHFTTAWFVATLSGTFINFFLNKYWTFRHLN